MNEIKCPKCGTIFQISETDYESIVKQIRDKEFEKEITIRENRHKIDKENAIELAKAHLEKELTNKLNEKNIEISELKNKISLKDKETELTIKNAITEHEKKLNL